MVRPALTGTRIRARRLDVGLRQAALARACGVSPSYLNLIEHNRRRIGGKLLNLIAETLEIDAAALSEGAETALLDGLSDAAADGTEAQPETDRAEEFAGRFPGWARLVSLQAARIGRLERTVEALSDRLGHDPHLATALHDILSTATSIRSSSAILADDPDIDREWQARFHRNMREDSQRLADAATGLVGYLDSGSEAPQGALTPQEELEQWLAEKHYHIPTLEGGGTLEWQDAMGAAQAFSDPAARDLAKDYLARYRADATRLPLELLKKSLAEFGPNPAAIARAVGVDLACVFRRLAALPPQSVSDTAGLATCDASGTLTFRKPIDGFSLPRFGAACSLLPLYQALSRPMSPVKALVEQAGGTPRTFLTYSVAQPAEQPSFDRPTVFEASMLILPLGPGSQESGSRIPVGPTCRICPRGDCSARREPSILAAP